MTRKATARRLVLNLSLLLFMACKPNCDAEPPTLTCDTVSIAVEPGQCVEFTNPCGNHEWVRLDAFRLCEPPPGLFLQTQRDPRARFLCADASMQVLNDAAVEYHYSGSGESGIGQFRISSHQSALSVAASATPTSVPLGGTSQLNAIAAGGSPPYTYAWTPAGSLNDATLANPAASPTVTTQYTVVVTDSIGTTANASLIVSVGLGADATAVPPSVLAGQSAALNLAAAGGTPPYTYSWLPTTGLNDPALQSPVATPAATTQYTGRVTDALGNTAVDSVTVTVIPATLNACFTLTTVGAVAARADATCATGTIVEYRWWNNFSGPGQPPDAVTTTPIRNLLYEAGGQFTVRLEVVDAFGATSAVTHVLTLP